MKSFLQILLFFLLITQIHYPQWTNQNPVPDGNNLWSTFFIDDIQVGLLAPVVLLKKLLMLVMNGFNKTVVQPLL